MFERTDDARADLARYFRTLTWEQLEKVKAVISDDDRELVERVMAEHDRMGWRATPLTMGVHLGALKMMPHTEYLASKFVDAVEGRSPFQIWNVPARHGKSLLASRWGPVWCLDRDPTMKLALTSYGDMLAGENSTAVRDLLIEHRDVLRARLRGDRQQRDRFATPEGGGLISAGVGSPLTGFGAHGIVVDDPFKNWQEAHSEARRTLIWNWFRAVVRTRLETREGHAGWIIVVMTRWHESDLTGMLLQAGDAMEGDEYEIVRLPAIAEDDDALGRVRGEPLAPELFTLSSLLARARALGSYLAAGMEQQRPAPEEGGEIKRAWWRWYTALPPRFDAACTSWDMKMKDKSDSGDFVVGQAWGRTGSDFWFREQVRGQWNLVTTKTAIALLAARHPDIHRHYIENTGNGPEVMEELRAAQPGYSVGQDVASTLGMTERERTLVNIMFRRGITGLIPNNARGDKVSRARAESGLVEAGNAHLPDEGLPHHEAAVAFVNECAAFPNNAAHDDQVDAWSQAFKRLRLNINTMPPRPPSERPTIGKPVPSARSRGTPGRVFYLR